MTKMQRAGRVAAALTGAATAALLLAGGGGVFAQAGLPAELRVTADGHLRAGAHAVTGFYAPGEVASLEILLAEPNWFQLLDGGRGRDGEPPVSLVGSVVYRAPGGGDSLRLDSVRVSIKGNTSDNRNRTEKKSFKLELDAYRDQRLGGYDNLNLNNAFEDPSGMREVVYYDLARAFAPALKANFVDVYVNGQYWGPYSNVQQVEGTYLAEWFGTNDGPRWRALRPDFGAGGGGGGFGTGFSSLNYLGDDSTYYTPHYTLKSDGGADDPWAPLMAPCELLAATPVEQLDTALAGVLDVDRTLWFLAQEIVFADDDSYVNKGGMDYYVYANAATGRAVPLEMDGNSAMRTNRADWSIFFNEDDARYPLLNRLLANARVRQRYLAHLRTLLRAYLVEADAHARIDAFAALLDARVAADPKAMFTHAEFVAGVEDLKRFVTERVAYLAARPALARPDLTLSDAHLFSAVGEGQPPAAGEPAAVTVRISGGDVRRVTLYHGGGFDGAFAAVRVLDDGQHGDGAAGDGVYGAELPGYPALAYVRYYVEAVADDAFGTASYLPAGAEHDVFVYRVGTGATAIGEVVVNELQASNDATVADAAGEFDDWIELYNRGDEPVDLAGYTLSDDDAEPDKYRLPAGTTLAPGAYLVVWADGDADQQTATELHAPFRLSAAGEVVLLRDASGATVDRVEFGPQTTDRSLARLPNGTGGFAEATPTFAADNDGNSGAGDIRAAKPLRVYPNPAAGVLHVAVPRGFAAAGAALDVTLADARGVVVRRAAAVDAVGTQAALSLDLTGLPAGLYVVRVLSERGAVLGTARVVVR